MDFIVTTQERSEREMSMPEFPKPETIPTRDEAINAIIASIAMEETALGRILEAESEKINYVLDQVRYHGADVETILKVNESATTLIERINDMQFILKNKLRLVSGSLPKPPCPPPKPHPDPICRPGIIHPCPKSIDPCISVFSAIEKYRWCGGSILNLEESSRCKNDIEIYRQFYDTLINLPANRSYKVELDLELINKYSSPVSIEFKITCGCDTVFLKEYPFEADKRHINIWDIPIMKMQKQRKDSRLSIRLLSEKSLEIRRGDIMINEV
jgi:hypothetical protein